MKTMTENPATFESIYALIVREEEPERTASEGAAFLAFILCVLFSIWQFVEQPVTLPPDGVIHTTSIAQTAGRAERV